MPQGEGIQSQGDRPQLPGGHGSLTEVKAFCRGTQRLGRTELSENTVHPLECLCDLIVLLGSQELPQGPAAPAQSLSPSRVCSQNSGYPGATITRPSVCVEGEG